MNRIFLYRLHEKYLTISSIVSTPPIVFLLYELISGFFQSIMQIFVIVHGAQLNDSLSFVQYVVQHGHIIF